MLKNIYSKVFMWMFVGLLVTFLTGFIVSKNENMLLSIFSSGLYFFLVIIELVLVIVLSARIHKMSITTAKIMFILYSFVTGLTFSSIFVVYNLMSIMIVFLVGSLLFGLFALFGSKTKLDLTKLGTILLMTLIGIIICTVINMFLNNSTFDLIISIISLIVFMLFVMFDIRKLKKLELIYDEDKFAIIGALELYLDFINIFLDLLHIFGNND